MNLKPNSRKGPVMKAAQWLAAALAASILAACGGGSSGSFDAGREARLSVAPAATSVPANPSNFSPNPNAAFTIQVNVNLTLANGSPAADGTTISLSSSNAARGVISTLAAPGETGGSATATTSGGRASFWFTSGSQTGSVTLTASTANPSGVGNLSASATIEVVPAAAPVSRLRIEGSDTMPTNRAGVPIFLGSPYINELTVRYVGPDGNAGEVEGGQISVAVSPVNRGAFSTLDDPSTDENEFLILVGAGPVIMTAGVTTLFIHSFDRPGPLTVSITAQDAGTGERFSQDFVINVEDGAADFLPAQLSFGVSPDPVYVVGSGGATTKPITLTVLDSGGNTVPNPVADGNAFNNVRLELDAPAGSGARLTGTGANGPVSGTSISVRTVNGIANFALNTGTEIGQHRITATVDRADNNVDNDIQDALSSQTTITVGDGQVFSIELVSPILNAILVNRTTADIETAFEGQVDPVSGAFIPPDSDGTYSFAVTALATDRVGNPALGGTTLSFGKIDSPLTVGLPSFLIFSGPDGDPEEGGVLFRATSPSEGFLDDPLRPDEAVEPGDTLVLFGKSVPGNREHEAARTIASVVDDRTVTVTRAFNPNDGTGAIVNDGDVIPWAIGRSQVGFIDGNLTLDSRGRGSVQLTYPINALGRPLVLWTQADRQEAGRVKTVADVNALFFPGVAPLVLTTQPSVVPGNTTVNVRLCATDALRAPINGLSIGGFIEGASGSLDGRSMPTSTERVTGTAGAGCVLTELRTTGLVPEGDEATVTFFVGEAEAEVRVAPPGAATLDVNPSAVTDTILSTFSRQLTLTLRSGDGSPIAGVGLEGSCSASDGVLELQVPPGVTDQNGRTTATVLIGMAGCGDSALDPSFPRTGQCTFTTSSGSPIGLFTAIGIDLRNPGGAGVSPPPPASVCPPLDDDD